MKLEDVAANDEQPAQGSYTWVRWFSPGAGLVFLFAAVYRRFFVLKNDPDWICFVLMAVGIAYILVSAFVETYIGYRKRQELIATIRSRKKTISLSDK
jgi:hypothetical protein